MRQMVWNHICTIITLGVDFEMSSFSVIQLLLFAKKFFNKAISIAPTTIKLSLWEWWFHQHVFWWNWLIIYIKNYIALMENARFIMNAFIRGCLFITDIRLSLDHIKSLMEIILVIYDNLCWISPVRFFSRVHSNTLYDESSSQTRAS